MSDPSKIDTGHLIERAKQQGVTIDPDRAEALRPKVASLLARLEKLGAGLPRGIEPPPMASPPTEP